MRRVLLACAVLAGISLLLPSAPTYDPWAWIVWGREVAHLSLDTTGGPSWKPLPVAFTTIFSGFGMIDDSIPPLLWLAVARAGALLAMALVFRLALRLAGGSRWGTAAGLVAATALALTPEWLRYAAHGNEAPLAVAAMLWAVERHLVGSRRAALALGFAACLMRPEVFPFLAAYAAWIWRSEPAARKLILVCAVALPAFWLVPEWIGSGNPLAAGAQARSEPSWSLSRQDLPWLALLSRAHEVFGPLLEAGMAVAVLLAWRERRRFELALGTTFVAWVILVAAMTQAGFSGNPRYLLPATVIACLLTGVGFVRLAQAAPRSVPAAAAAMVLAAVAISLSAPRVTSLADQARTAAHTAQLDDDLALAVSRMGGGDAVVRRGAPTSDRAFVPHLAWLTTLPVGDVERSAGTGLVFAAGKRNPSTLVAQTTPPPDLSGLTEVGRWKVYLPRQGPARGSRR